MSSIHNSYPFPYSSNADVTGMLLSNNADGTNVIIDFNTKKPNGHVLILGKSGEGRSCNFGDERI